MGGLDQWMTVVGFTRDTLHHGLDQPMQPGIYIPHKMWKSSHMYLMVRSTVASAGLLSSIRSELHAIDPDVGIFDPRTMAGVVNRSMFNRRALSMVMTEARLLTQNM
jgi:hypothetical protein